MQDAPGWEAGAPGQLAFAALLRACEPGMLQALLPVALQILSACTSPERCVREHGEVQGAVHDTRFSWSGATPYSCG